MASMPSMVMLFPNNVTVMLALQSNLEILFQILFCEMTCTLDSSDM
jgi:hypothetical protein